MHNPTLEKTGKSPGDISADCAFQAVEAGDFKNKLFQYLDNFEGEFSTRPRQMIRAHSDPEPGTIVQTAAPPLEAGRISWLCLADCQKSYTEKELKSQLEMGFSFLEEKKYNVILLLAPENLKSYPEIDNPLKFMEEFLTNLSTSSISRVKIFSPPGDPTSR